jgi:hypothetical protein
MMHTEPDLPTIGIWLMPDNSTPGALEQFARLLVPGSDKLWPEAETVVQHIKSIEQRFRMTYEMKATLHTWLAWQKEPGKPIGQAMIKHFLDLKISQREWIVQLVADLVYAVANDM